MPLVQNASVVSKSSNAPVNMIYRELRPEENQRLEGHPALNGLGVPSPDVAKIVIAERENGEIIGFQMAVTVVHLEPIWVHPDYRGSMVPMRLWKTATRLLDALLIKVAFCFSEDSTIANYLSRLGLRELPYKTHVYDPEHHYPR